MPSFDINDAAGNTLYRLDGDGTADRKSQVRQCLDFGTADFDLRWHMNQLDKNPNIA